MQKTRIPIFTFFASLLVVLGMALTPAMAGAATGGDITVRLYRLQSPFGQVSVDLLDRTVGHTLRIRRGDGELGRISVNAGSRDVALGSPALRPGDVIELYRPAIPNGAPTVPPLDTYVVPPVSVAYADSAVTGTVGESTQARLDYIEPCGSLASGRRVGLDLVAGEFTDRRQLAPGTQMELSAFDGTGDVTTIDAAAPGETACLIAYTSEPPFLSPSDPASATPYRVYVYGLSDKIAASVRLVWKRGEQVVHDTSGPGSTISIDSATRPEPGDRFEIYRPMNSQDPFSVQTIPRVRAVFDPKVGRLALNGPAAASFIGYLFDVTGYDEASETWVKPVAAGRTVVDFQDPARPVLGPPFPGLNAGVDWEARGGTPRLSFRAERGDLQPPGVRVLAGRRIRLPRSGRSLALEVRSTEAVTGKLTLEVRDRSNRRARLALAVARIDQPAGTRRVIARLTRNGRAEVKRMGRTGASRVGTLALEVKDAAGNTKTSARKIGLVTR